MSEPSMKQVWAGLAMMALLTRRNDNLYEGDFADIALDAWRMADHMEKEEQDRDE